MANLERMTHDVLDIYAQYQDTGTRHWTYETAIIDLSSQIGSLTRCLLQLRGERYCRVSPRELKDQIGDELADILAEVLFISHELDIDLQRCWEKMIESDTSKIEKRRPVKALSLL